MRVEVVIEGREMDSDIEWPNALLVPNGGSTVVLADGTDYLVTRVEWRIQGSPMIPEPHVQIMLKRWVHQE